MAFNISRIAFLGIRQQTNIKLINAKHRTALQQSCYSFSSTSNEDFSGPKEMSIPVPWGHIAGKQWGNETGKPIMALHGYLDNASSMDGIMPLMPLSEYNVVAIDLPGHGFSSQYAPGMAYRVSDAIVAVRRVQKHLGWEKSSIIGHSMGAAIASMFAATFYEHVDRLVLIDLVNVAATPLQKHAKSTRKALLKSIELIDKVSKAKELPAYTFEDACGRAFLANQFIHGTDSITRSSVETLMSRGLRKVGTNKNGDDMFTWTTDFRLRVPSPFHVVQEQVEHYAEQIQCPLLVIKASDSPWYMSEENAEKILKVYSNGNPNFVLKKVDGGHHVHLNEPEKVAPLIVRFLKKQFRDSGTEDKENVPVDLF